MYPLLTQALQAFVADNNRATGRQDMDIKGRGPEDIASATPEEFAAAETWLATVPAQHRAGVCKAVPAGGTSYLDSAPEEVRMVFVDFMQTLWDEEEEPIAR